jgi:hypothetical protein
MTFANRFVRGAVLGAVAMGLLGVANAQNGSNYHVLSNNQEGPIAGIGAGGTQTGNDGLGVWVPGEDMKGSLQVDFGAFGGVQFSYRNIKFRESLCLFNAAVGPHPVPTLNYAFDGLLFTEFDGMNGNRPPVFTNPVCITPIPSVNAPYGTWAQSTASFILFGMPSGIGVTGVPTSALMLGPNNGIVTSAGADGPGTATIVAAAGSIVSNNLAQSGCYAVQFSWLPSSVPYLDKIDGMWHYLLNSDLGNQYWMLSTDEMAIWQSQTVFTTGGPSVPPEFLPAFADLGFQLASVEANTTAALAPNGYAQNGTYYAQTENMAPSVNSGFDVGRGSMGISFNGSGGTKTGVAFGGLGNGNQDPGFGGATPRLGFVTWDNKPNSSVAGFGSTRLTWLSIDFGGAFGFSPDVDLNVTKGGGTVRVPMLTNPPAGGPIQPITTTAFSIFGHTTKLATSGWPDPDGLPVGFAGVIPSAGGSTLLSTSAFSGSIPCSAGLSGIPLNITYGSSGLAPGLTWDPSVADISGTKQLFLFP